MFDPGDLDNAQTIPIRPFSLPKADFGAMMFSKRLASEGSSSPALLDQPVRQKTKLGARGSRIADPKARASMVEPNDEGSPKSPPPARNRYVTIEASWTLFIFHVVEYMVDLVPVPRGVRWSRPRRKSGWKPVGRRARNGR